MLTAKNRIVEMAIVAIENPIDIRTNLAVETPPSPVCLILGKNIHVTGINQNKRIINTCIKVPLSISSKERKANGNEMLQIRQASQNLTRNLEK